jgi:Cyclic phosphodiesterase-like protein
LSSRSGVERPRGCPARSITHFCLRRMPKSTALVYWLIPTKPQRDFFSEAIRILSKQFNAPRFEPHLTIIVTPEIGLSPRKILKQIRTSPISLGVRGIGFSSKFTKTLFVRFTSNKSLAKLVVDLARETQSPAKSAHDPHVSLIYREMPTSTKKELASTIQLPFSTVLFDSIKAVRCASPTKTRSDVEAWRVVAKKSLRW